MIATPGPVLGNNEKILFEVPNIEIKSIEFRLYLTNRRLFLAEDSTKASSPIEVPLPVISSIRTGQTVSDEPTLILSIRAPNGSQKKMTLTFSQDFSGMRNMERDYLKKELEGLTSEYVPSSIPQEEPEMPVRPPETSQFSGSPASGFSTTGAVGQGGVLLQAHNIIVKSQEFTIKLTKDEISLTDPNHPNKPASISLKSVRNVETGTNQQKEPTLILHVESPNGEMRKMNLTFSHWHKGDRWGERDTWAGAVRDIIATGGKITNIPGLGSYAQKAMPPQTPESSAASSGFSARPPETKFCQECGNPLPKGSKFCRECGAPAGVQGTGAGDGSIIDADGGGDDLFPPGPAPGAQRKTRKRRPPKRRKPVKKREKRVRTKPSRDPLGLGGGSSYSPDESVAGRLIGFIRAPSETYLMTKEQDLREALPVLVLALAIFGFVTGIIFQLYAGSLDTASYPEVTALKETGSMLFFVIEIIILGLIYTMINGVLLHLGLLITGYGEDVQTNIKIVAYSMCPFAVAGLIPLFGLLIAPFWAFFLQFLGVKETYNLDTGKAAMAAAIPAIIIILLLLFFIGEGETGFRIFGDA